MLLSLFGLKVSLVDKSAQQRIEKNLPDVVKFMSRNGSRINLKFLKRKFPRATRAFINDRINDDGRILRLCYGNFKNCRMAISLLMEDD